MEENVNVITIKAELLKWTRFRFLFKSEDQGFYYDFYDETCEIVFADNRESCFSSNVEVIVNAKDYEKAVINTISNMLTLPVKKIVKSFVDDEPENTFSYITVYDEDGWDIQIDADPRPHEKEYVIEVAK